MFYFSRRCDDTFSQETPKQCEEQWRSSRDCAMSQIETIIGMWDSIEEQKDFTIVGQNIHEISNLLAGNWLIVDYFHETVAAKSMGRTKSLNLDLEARSEQETRVSSSPDHVSSVVSPGPSTGISNVRITPLTLKHVWNVRLALIIVIFNFYL